MKSIGTAAISMQDSASPVQVFRATLVVALFAFFGYAHAADKDKLYKVEKVYAVESCERLNAAVAKAKNEDDWGSLYGFSLYTMGYLTAINRLADDTYDITGQRNVKTLLVRMEKYCAENPTESFDRALYRLVAELYPARVLEAPSAGK